MRILPVSEFVEIINSLLRETLATADFVVEGEVSGYRVSQGQWVTFDLKDEKALVNIFMPLWDLHVPVQDGMRVRVRGLPRIYPKYGKFSISAEAVELVGEGALRKALIQLRERLMAEGLFDPSRKRELPRFPRRIALVASRESAAFGDFIRILNERWGGLEIDVYHVLVQGERAPREIVAALQQAQAGAYDALVLTRGGGSFEELMAFNDERVVRALHASKIPTLVGIGHERDVTLAEEVADVRGSTPTDCARRLVPDRRDIQYELAAVVELLEGSLRERFGACQQIVARALIAPQFWLQTRQAELEQAKRACVAAQERWFLHLKERLLSFDQRLVSLDPVRVLQRGYAFIHDTEGHIVTSVKDVRVGDGIGIRMKDGEIQAIISTGLDKWKAQGKLL